jgi:hypothetical protein
MKKYTNRYGMEFTFERNKGGNIDWKGNFQYCRFSFDKSPNDITMVDPIGGPLLKVGMFMDRFGLAGIIDGFINNGGSFEILLK